MRKLGALSGVAALLVLAVVAASAAIRSEDLAASVALARGAHRAAASLAALAVFAVAGLSWKHPELRAAAFGALGLTLALSVIGVATGTEPPRAAAYANQLGGLSLAALLAWLCGRTTPSTTKARALRPLASAALAFAALQVFGGASVVTLWKGAPAAVFMIHAATGLAAAALLAALGLRYATATAPRYGAALAALALAAPALGLASVLAGGALAAPAHALAAATLLAAAAHARASA